MKQILFNLVPAVAAAASLLSVVLCIADKLRSKKKGKSRIPEADLMLTSAFGGALFMFLTMIVIRHKTRHPKFMIGLPLMILFQAALCCLIYF